MCMYIVRLHYSTATRRRRRAHPFDAAVTRRRSSVAARVPPSAARAFAFRVQNHLSFYARVHCAPNPWSHRASKFSARSNSHYRTRSSRSKDNDFGFPLQERNRSVDTPFRHDRYSTTGDTTRCVLIRGLFFLFLFCFHGRRRNEKLGEIVSVDRVVTVDLVRELQHYRRGRR